MRTINKIILLGYVGQDCNVNVTAQGLKVAGFSLATSIVKKDGAKVTQWHNCVAFAKTADIVEQFAKKGARLYIDGEMQYSEYEKEGVKMLSAKVVVNTISVIDFKEDDTSRAAPQAAKKQPAFDDSDFPF